MLRTKPPVRGGNRGCEAPRWPVKRRRRRRPCAQAVVAVAVGTAPPLVQSWGWLPPLCRCSSRSPPSFGENVPREVCRQCLVRGHLAVGGGPFGPLRNAGGAARDPSASRDVAGWLSAVSVWAYGPSRRCDLLHLVSLRLALESTRSGSVCLLPPTRYPSVAPVRTITGIADGSSPRTAARCVLVTSSSLRSYHPH